MNTNRLTESVLALPQPVKEELEKVIDAMLAEQSPDAIDIAVTGLSKQEVNASGVAS